VRNNSKSALQTKGLDGLIKDIDKISEATLEFAATDTRDDIKNNFGKKTQVTSIGQRIYLEIGADKYRVRITKAGDMSMKSVSKVARKGARRTIVRSSPGETPNIDSGDLYNSVKSYRVSKLIWMTQAGDEKAYYVLFLEYGTSKMAARPFFRPAIYRAEKKFSNYFKVVFA
jgi:HK97 gp10 family phage protein